MAKVKNLLVKKIEVKMTYNTDLDEYEIAWIEDGVWSEAKTYYTNDKEDAILTEARMKKEAGVILYIAERDTTPPINCLSVKTSKVKTTPTNMSKTKTRFTISMEVVIDSAGGIDANAETLKDKITHAIENLPGSYKGVVDIRFLRIDKVGSWVAK